MVLCIESSTTVCSVALSHGDETISVRETNSGFTHAENLTVYISELISEAGIKIKDLDAVAVSAGPGSYTGLRIGISAAKGLCFSSDIPLISISTLESMAYAASKEIKSDNYLLCPMIDARRMEVYCALYDQDLKEILPPSAIVIDRDFLSAQRNSKMIFYFGDGAEKCKPILDTIAGLEYYHGILPSAKHLAHLADVKLKSKQFENVSLFEPVYLKEYKVGVKK